MGIAESSSKTRALALLTEASQILECSECLEEIRLIRDKSEAARVLARAAKLGLETQNRAATVKLQAERKAGKYLSGLKLRGGDRKSNSHRERLKLADLNISQNESRRWQLEASVSDDDFEEYIRTSAHHGREVTSAGLIRFVNSRRTRNNHKNVVNATSYGESADIIAEIESHRQLLSRIVSAFNVENEVVPKPAECRHAVYLVAEIGKLLNRLSRLVN